MAVDYANFRRWAKSAVPSGKLIGITTDVFGDVSEGGFIRNGNLSYFDRVSGTTPFTARTGYKIITLLASEYVNVSLYTYVGRSNSNDFSNMPHTAFYEDDSLNLVTSLTFTRFIIPNEVDTTQFKDSLANLTQLHNRPKPSKFFTYLNDFMANIRPFYTPQQTRQGGSAKRRQNRL